MRSCTKAMLGPVPAGRFGDTSSPILRALEKKRSAAPDGSAPTPHERTFDHTRASARCSQFIDWRLLRKFSEQPQPALKIVGVHFDCDVDRLTPAVRV